MGNKVPSSQKFKQESQDRRSEAAIELAQSSDSSGGEQKRSREESQGQRGSSQQDDSGSNGRWGKRVCAGLHQKAGSLSHAGGGKLEC